MLQIGVWCICASSRHWCLLLLLKLGVLGDCLLMLGLVGCRRRRMLMSGFRGLAAELRLTLLNCGCRRRRLLMLSVGCLCSASGLLSRILGCRCLCWASKASVAYVWRRLFMFGVGCLFLARLTVVYFRRRLPALAGFVGRASCSVGSCLET